MVNSVSRDKLARLAWRAFVEAQPKDKGFNNIEQDLFVAYLPTRPIKENTKALLIRESVDAVTEHVTEYQLPHSYIKRQSRRRHKEQKLVFSLLKSLYHRALGQAPTKPHAKETILKLLNILMRGGPKYSPHLLKVYLEGFEFLSFLVKSFAILNKDERLLASQLFVAAFHHTSKLGCCSARERRVMIDRILRLLNSPLHASAQQVACACLHSEELASLFLNSGAFKYLMNTMLCEDLTRVSSHYDIVKTLFSARPAKEALKNFMEQHYEEVVGLMEQTLRQANQFSRSLLQSQFQAFVSDPTMASFSKELEPLKKELSLG